MIGVGISPFLNSLLGSTAPLDIERFLASQGLTGSTVGGDYVRDIYWAPGPLSGRVLRVSEADHFAAYVAAGTSSRSYYDQAGALRFDLTANQPRFTWEGGRRRLLLENTGTNLFTESEFRAGLANTSTRGNAVAVTDFEGGRTGIALNNSGSTTAYAYKAFTVVEGVTYTLSTFVEMEDGLPPQFPDASATSPNNTFSFVANPAPGGTIPVATYRADKAGEKVWRVQGTFTSNVNVTANAFGVAQYTANQQRRIKVTGFQIEAGPIATSYIKTEAAAVTRPIETFRLAPEACAVMQGAAATALVQGRLNGPLSTTRILGGDASGVVHLGAQSSGNVFSSNGTGAETVFSAPGAGGFNAGYGAVLSFDASGKAVCLNGGAVGQNAFSVGGSSSLYLGRTTSTNSFGDGLYDRVALFPERVSDARLQQMAVPYA